MKQLYILLFLGICLSGFGQTYTATFNYPDTSLLCTQDLDLIEFYCTPLTEYYWSIKSNGSILSEIDGASTSIIVSNLPVKNNYDVLMGYYCSGMQLNYLSCDPGSQFNMEQIITSIKEGRVDGISLSNERPGIIMTDFMPNGMLIKNLDNNLICAGQQLELQCFPDGFPEEAYHWQYSLDNKVTWIDVPSKVVNGYNINNSKVSKFTIYDILGNDHINHIGPIDFRIGYADRPFSTNTIQINYSACGPTISNVSFEGPECSGNIVKSLAVTFNEELNSAVGEKLATLSVVDINDESKIFMQVDGPISYPDDTKKYTYTNFQQLENGHTYRIKYQAQIANPADVSNAIMRGFLYSPEKYNFLYTEPDPLKFQIKEAYNPKCTDDTVEISIAVTGGTGDYKFYLDGIEKKNPIPVKEADGYYHIKGLIPTAVNSIKVVDENNCIEKTL